MNQAAGKEALILPSMKNGSRNGYTHANNLCTSDQCRKSRWNSDRCRKSTYAVRSVVGMELAREIMRSKYERKRWLLKKEPPRIVPLTLFWAPLRREDVSVRILINTDGSKMCRNIAILADISNCEESVKLDKAQYQHFAISRKTLDLWRSNNVYFTFFEILQWQQ